jgi:hypothetical protein
MNLNQNLDIATVGISKAIVPFVSRVAVQDAARSKINSTFRKFGGSLLLGDGC